MNLREVSKQDLQKYLQFNNWIASNDVVTSLEKAGEGNMNLVLRVYLRNGNSIVLKQSSSFVEKYPQIKAPIERIFIEYNYYKAVQENSYVANRMPQLFHFDKENSLIALEDLGKSIDFLAIYNTPTKLSENEIAELATYLQELHSISLLKKNTSLFTNSEMRKLNHEHIFIYPFLNDNGFDLNTIQNGLQDLAIAYRKDTLLKSKIDALGEIYLKNGDHLLHGDFYPGSWLKISTKAIKIIDPEFCFLGSREFDLGVFIAHLYLSQHSKQHIELVERSYKMFHELDNNLVYQFAGVEIIRRLIGLAQLPLKLSVENKKKLLRFGANLILKFEE